MKLSKTINSLYAEGAFVWGDYAFEQEKKSGRPVLRLQIGQPDFSPHQLLRKAISEAYLEGRTGYGATLGLKELRTEVAKEIQSYYKNIKVNKDNIAITSGGGKLAIGAVCKALINQKDKILVPCYGYPGHFSGISDAGGIWVPYRLVSELNYDVDLNDLERQIKKTKAKIIFLLSPGNPTGGVISSETMEKIAFLVKKYDLTVVSDEIYRGHVFDGKFISIADFPGMFKRTIIIDGPGKRNCVPGIRIGYIIGPKDFIDGPIRKINNVKFSCPPTPEQIGLAKTINNKEIIDYIKEMRDEFKKRRDVVVELLNSIKGIFCPKPGGAFYVFPDISKTKLTGEQFAKRLLKEKNVCVLPGESFGGGMIDPKIKKPYGTYNIRISIASSLEILKEAIKRIREFVESL